MRRAVFAILGTAAATSLLVGLKAQTEQEQPAEAAQEQEQQEEPAPSGSGPAESGPGQPAGDQPPAQAGDKRTIKGDTIETPYGRVTVTITVTGDKITDITAVLPSGADSATVTTNAGPKLRQQALEKQSADIDSVSGATYTSEAYKESLQSALDKR
jgi:uncharacterized protein with FMN-binding domain